MAAIFGRGKFFLKLPIVHFLDTLWVENFDKIALSRTVKEIGANLCFSIFGKHSKIQNGRHFWGEENILKIAKSTLDTLWVENFDKISLSCTVKQIEANLRFFHFWQKVRKFKMATIFGESKIF